MANVTSANWTVTKLADERIGRKRVMSLKVQMVSGSWPAAGILMPLGPQLGFRELEYFVMSPPTATTVRMRCFLTTGHTMVARDARLVSAGNTGASILASTGAFIAPVFYVHAVGS